MRDAADGIEVSILIPIHNCKQLTAECLESIRKYTAGVSYELILVDDASDEETRTFLVEVAQSFVSAGIPAKVLRNETRCSFSVNNNKAAEAAAGEYLCLLNNDTLVTPGWLSSLVEVMLRSKNIGVLGNKHLFPKTELLHHCGMDFDDQGHPFHLHPHADPKEPAFSYQRDVQAVTFACVLIPRSVYRALSGLSEEFKNGYEDCDFCLRAKRAGYRVTYTPASVIYHYGQSTPGRKNTDDTNWKTFSSKWSSSYSRDLDEVTKSDRDFNLLVTSRPLKRPKRDGIHFVCDLSEPSAFSWLLAELALAASELGTNVSFSPCTTIGSALAPEKIERLRELMNDRPCTDVHIKFSHYWEKYLKADLAGDVNAELIAVNYRYRATHRLDPWMRHVLANDNRKLPISSFCRDALLDIGLSPERARVIELGYSPEVAEVRKERKRGEPLSILLVTNSHDLYRYGTDIAVKSLAKAFGPQDDVVVHIKDYGAASGSNQLRQWIASQERFPRHIFHERFTSKQELLQLYSNSDLFLAPFRGEGYAMKILDAFALGLPVLMPGFGGPMEYAREGDFVSLPYSEVPVGECYDTLHYNLSPDAYWCEVNEDGLAHSLTSAVSGIKELTQKAASVSDRILRDYSWKSVTERFLSNLRTWRTERDVTVSTRMNPSTLPLSIVIPTKDRVDTLQLTLDGYTAQSDVSSRDFEIVLVNDHGDAEALRRGVEPYKNRLQMRILENNGHSGPGYARNLGIDQSHGDLIFITGDDIIPSPDLLSSHLQGHRAHPALESAFVGLNLWHKDVPLNWMMLHLIGDGGQQFNYTGMLDREVVPFDRFYTSNVSLKRHFIGSMEQMFSTEFRFAACEDIEIAYRLRNRGMELRYLEGAVGYHLHPMTLRSFLDRQNRVGRMMTVLCYTQPGFVPEDHMQFLKLLDSARAMGVSTQPSNLPEPAALIEDLIRYYDSLDETIKSYESLLATPINEGFKRRMIGAAYESRRVLFDDLCEMKVRLGMAEEWAQTDEERAWATRWVSQLALGSYLRNPNFYLSLGQHAEAAAGEKRMSDVQIEHAMQGKSTVLGPEQIRKQLHTLRSSEGSMREQIARQEQEMNQLRRELDGIRRWVSEFSITKRARSKLQDITGKVITRTDR